MHVKYCQRQQLLVDQKVKKLTELLQCTFAVYDCRQLEDVSRLENIHMVTEIISQVLSLSSVVPQAVGAFELKGPLYMTGRSLKTRFRERFRKMKKPKKFDTFFYRHLKSNGHSPCKIVIQPVEKIVYDPNSSTRLKI